MKSSRLFTDNSQIIAEMITNIKNNRMSDSDFYSLLSQKEIKFTKDQLSDLSKAFKYNTTFYSLNFERMTNTFSGESLQNFLNSIEQNKESKVIAIDFGALASNENFAVLGAFLEKNQKILSFLANLALVGDEGCIAIGEGLKKTSILRCLNLCHCPNITNVGIKAISEGLLLNNSVQYAFLDVPGMTEEGANALEKVLLQRLENAESLPIQFGVTEHAKISENKIRTLQHLEEELAHKNTKNNNVFF